MDLLGAVIDIFWNKSFMDLLGAVIDIFWNKSFMDLFILVQNNCLRIKMLLSNASLHLFL